MLDKQSKLEMSDVLLLLLLLLLQSLEKKQEKSVLVYLLLLVELKDQLKKKPSALKELVAGTKRTTDCIKRVNGQLLHNSPLNHMMVQQISVVSKLPCVHFSC